MTAARIRRLAVTNFRSYRAAQLATGATMVVLTGANGAGKTNLIEAISYLTPGRGLRRATFEDVAFNEGDGSFAISAEVEGALGLATLGTGAQPVNEDAAPKRLARIDREPVGSVTAFADHLRVIWMTPAMDSLFTGAAAERRRFIDRLVLAIDPQHSSRVSALERALRSRNRLLSEPAPDTHWLDAIEHETAEVAVAVAASRAETVRRLQGALAASDDAIPFPRAAIALDGAMEAALLSENALAVEDGYRATLRNNRSRDAAAGRTTEGPHVTDLQVRYAAKDIPAGQASTGEQKALLIRLILAHAGLTAGMTGTAPVLLLDEVVAHLDPDRRAALYDALEAIGGQVWMTGADPAAFGGLRERAEIFTITPGHIGKA